MKNYCHTLRVTAAAVCLAAASIFIGCESESADTAKITVSPSSATLTSGGASVSLSASGGWNYLWELGDDSIGKLDKHTGSKVVYTATAFGSGGSNLVQTVTVSAAGSTNLLAASVSITQK